MNKMDIFGSKKSLCLDDLYLQDKINIYNSKDFIKDTVEISPEVVTVNDVSEVILKLTSSVFSDTLTITDDGNIKSEKHGVLINWFKLYPKDFVSKYYTKNGDYLDTEIFGILEQCSDKLVKASGFELVSRENLKAVLFRMVSAQDNPLVPRKSVRQNIEKVDWLLDKMGKLPDTCSLANAIAMAKDLNID